MNQIFDKLGIYDLVAVLLSGVCITVFSVLIEKVFFQSNILCLLKIDSFLFWIISYFVGLIFQECSSTLHKRVMYKNNKCLLKALDTTSKQSHQTLTQEEKDAIVRIVQKQLGLNTKPNVEVLYNYCKFYVAANSNMAKADKDQSLYGMSRSLSLYFFVVSIAVMCSKVFNQCVLHFICVLAIFTLSVLLHYRSERFAIMRYVYIFRAFYYGYLQTNTKKERRNKKAIVACKQ